MRSHLTLIQAVILLLCLLAAVVANGDAPEEPSSIPVLPIYEDGFEDFVGCGDGAIAGAEQCDDFDQAGGDGLKPVGGFGQVKAFG